MAGLKSKPLVDREPLEVYFMKYAVCTNCGRRLFKGEPGTRIEMDCPKCGKFVSVIIDADDLHISGKPLHNEEAPPKQIVSVKA